MNSKTKRLVMTALFIALGTIVPQAFHMLGLGPSQVFLPMHLPVMICGSLLGPIAGLICGLITPLLSSVLTGMPPLMPCWSGNGCGAGYLWFGNWLSD